MSILVCKYCGSADIVKDATARWNGEAWELSGTFDDTTCQSCGRDSNTLIITQEEFLAEKEVKP